MVISAWIIDGVVDACVSIMVWHERLEFVQNVLIRLYTFGCTYADGVRSQAARKGLVVHKPYQPEYSMDVHNRNHRD